MNQVSPTVGNITDYKSFRFGKISLEKKGESDQHIDIEIHQRKNDKAICYE